MKLTGVFVVLSLTLCCFSGVSSSDDGTEVDCSGYLQISGPDGKEMFACPSVFKLICGTDGDTYTSECKICDHNLKHGTNVGKKHNGVCKQGDSTGKGRLTSCQK